MVLGTVTSTLLHLISQIAKYTRAASESHADLVTEQTIDIKYNHLSSPTTIMSP